MSQLLNSCTTTILYGWKFRTLCKILLMLRLDVHRAAEYLLAERVGLLMNDCLTASVFCGDCVVHALPAGLFFNAEALILKFSTHNCMVLCQGTFSWRAILKCMRNIRCILTTESFCKNVSTMKVQCCTLHYSMATATVSVKLESDMVPAMSSSGGCQHNAF
jgi:hypothetical protein